MLFAFIQFGRIFTIKRRMEITNKFIPLTFTLCIGVILFFLIPLLKNDDIVSKLITFFQIYGMLLIVIFLSGILPNIYVAFWISAGLNILSLFFLLLSRRYRNILPRLLHLIFRLKLLCILLCFYLHIL